jgi:hypothetical protein
MRGRIVVVFDSSLLEEAIDLKQRRANRQLAIKSVLPVEPLNWGCAYAAPNHYDCNEADDDEGPQLVTSN